MTLPRLTVNTDSPSEVILSLHRNAYDGSQVDRCQSSHSTGSFPRVLLLERALTNCSAQVWFQVF